jgi:DNA/RNA endonuclease G (NUC1)
LVVLKENGIPIPERLYKIIKCNSHEGKAYLSAFTFSNSETYDNGRSLVEFRTPLEEVERATGLRFAVEGEELEKVDPIGLRLTKKELDYEFYFKLMASAETVG